MNEAQYTLPDLRIIKEALDQHAIVSIADASGNITYVNDKFCQISHYSRDELIGKNHRLLKSGTHDAKFFDDMWQNISSGRTWRGEICNRSKDGGLYWVETTIVPSLDGNGLPCQYVSVRTEITKIKQAEIALAQSAAELEMRVQQRTADLQQEMEGRREREAALAQFKNILDSTLDGVFIFQPDTLCIVYVNHGGIQQVGYSEDELLRMTPLDFSEQDFRTILKPLQDGWATAKTFETLLRHKDGYDFPVEIVVQLVRRGAEEPCYVAFSRDITERKQVEVDLRISAAAFESHESLIITDADGVILRVNQAFTKTTGYTSEEAVGQTPRLLKSGRHDAAFYAAIWETIHRTGTWQGELWDRRKSGEIYPTWLTISTVKGEDGVVTHYVGSHIDITERRAAEEKIQHLAFYDPLTRLPNRRLLMDRLNHALASSARSGREGALLFIDLDNFKTLNDTLGHNIGDSLLQQVAQRLESCVREGDTVARLGGDEFVVVLENLSEQHIEAAEQAKAVGEKILVSLNQPYQLATHENHSTPSIGANLFSGHQQTIEELLKQADIAMYQAKKAGRNSLRFFDPTMQKAINERSDLERELRKALEKQQFQLYYQIQVDSSSRPLGAEALIRWIHPERGMVSPAQFIPLAEETKLIVLIGQWVLETACAQLKAWEHDALSCDLVLSVNVSAQQFFHTDFVDQVKTAIQRHAINPNLLKLELTESMLLDNIENIVATMIDLKAVGVRFSLDDFGTGYSSLQYLKKLPLNQLKIDRSFVSELAVNDSDKAIVSTIIAMAHNLQLDVIAEGVETDEQRQFLMNAGCIHYQGYLFGKPVPVEQFEELLKQS